MSIFDLLAMGFASIGLFGAARLMRGWKAAPDNRRILSGLLVLLSLNVLHPVMTPIHFPGIFEPLEYLVPPLAWFLAQHLVAPTRWAWKNAAHLLPSALVLLWGYVNPLGLLGLLLAWILLIVQAIGYGLLTARALHRYRRQLLDNLSNLEGIDPKWLSSFLFIVAALVAIYAATMFLLLGSPGQTAFRPFLSLALGLTTCFVAWIALDQRYIPPQPLAPPVQARELSPEAKRILGLLPDFMRRKRPFLDPDLSLGDLAEAMETSRNVLSLALNVGLARTFYDYINEFRIREVIRLMADPERRNHKVLALALDAGFNSKTSFNELFKKATGQTPSAYRRGLPISLR
jgi:AraC-like DNA-binding protein